MSTMNVIILHNSCCCEIYIFACVRKSIDLTLQLRPHSEAATIAINRFAPSGPVSSSLC